MKNELTTKDELNTLYENMFASIYEEDMELNESTEEICPECGSEYDNDDHELMVCNGCNEEFCKECLSDDLLCPVCENNYKDNIVVRY